MAPTPAWVRLALIALGAVMAGLGLLLGWIAWSMVSDGLIHSNRYAAVHKVDDPIRFWIFLSVVILFAALAIAAGCCVVRQGIRHLRRQPARRPPDVHR